MGDVIFPSRFRRPPNTAAEAEWCDAHEAGRYTRTLARKTVADMVKARCHRRLGNVFMLRRMVREALEARAAYHNMLRLWNAVPGFRDGLLRRDRVLTATHRDGAA